MAGDKGLAYAEQHLGVHSVHDEAHTLTNEAAVLRQKIVTLKHAKADAEALYLDAEYDFISDLRGANKDMSQTAFHALSKTEVHRDANLRSIRATLASSAAEIERAEADLSTLKLRIEIAVARMHELGGYLGYLASLKNAETLAKHGEAMTKAMDRVESWPPDPNAVT
jgi:hypothetical protein